MSKIGLTLAKPQWESPLSAHFGMAKWLLIYDTETQEKQFRQSKELIGRDVAATLKEQGCTDAVFSGIGPGALRHLDIAGIRAWYGPKGVSAHELVERLGRGELQRAEEPREPGRARGVEGRGRSWGGEGHGRRHGFGRGRGRGCRGGKGRCERRGQHQGCRRDVNASKTGN